MPPSSPSSSSRTLHHTPSLSPSLDLQPTPGLPELHTSIMSPTKKEQAPIAGTSALEIIKPAQPGISFLSLPAEIRNMIYNYIFTPVRDGTSLVIYVKLDDPNCIKGSRRRCTACHADLKHPSCRFWGQSEEGWIRTLDFTDGYRHSGVLRTCHAILNEATPIALSHMHLVLDFESYFTKSATKVMEIILRSMRKSQGAYISKVTHVSFGDEYESQTPNRLLDFINRSDVKIGHFEIYELWDPSRSNHQSVKGLINILDTLRNKPVTVAWVDRRYHPSYQFEKQRVEFNGAVEKWLTRSAMVKTASPAARLPLLRDFLPQYFDSSAD